MTRPNRRARRAGERASDRLTHGVVHGDPAPDCVLIDGEDVGVVDWAAVMTGSLIYDLATVRVLTGDQAVLEEVAAGYLATALGARPDELADLPVALGPRWAARAVYFTDRISRGVTRGPNGPDARHNEDGPRAALTGLGVEPGEAESIMAVIARR